MDFNIVYIAFVGQLYGGVEQKVISQFDALVKQTTNVHMLLVSSFAPVGTFDAEIKKRPCIQLLVNSPNKVKNPLTRRKDKFQLISIQLKKYNPQNTMVYFRYPDSDYEFLRFLKAHNNYKIITEHQGIESNFSTNKFPQNIINNIFERIYGKPIRKRIYAFVGVTPEITEFQVKKSGQADKKSITSGNGINVLKYSMRKLNRENPEIIKILFVGSGYSCHGLDRLLKGIASYMNSRQATYRISLRLAGHSNSMKSSYNLAVKLGIENYVEFLGNKSVQELNEHYDWADIGAGSLAFHRIGLNYTSNLKAREYFSRGIPFFSSSVDKDLIECSKYIHIVEADESPINFENIIQFALQARSDSDHPEEMRNYSIANLDWSIKMASLLAFLKILTTNADKA